MSEFILNNAVVAPVSDGGKRNSSRHSTTNARAGKCCEIQSRTPRAPGGEDPRGRERSPSQADAVPRDCPCLAPFPGPPGPKPPPRTGLQGAGRPRCVAAPRNRGQPLSVAAHSLPSEVKGDELQNEHPRQVEALNSMQGSCAAMTG